MLALGALIALAAVLRFAALGDQSFWLDEAFTYRIVHAPGGDFLNLIEQGENTPPLYYGLVWLWTKVFGGGEAGLRSLSAVAGTATVPVAYAIGRQLASHRAGLMLAAFVAVCPFLVWYSQEARSYALIVLFTSLTLLFALRFRDEATRGNLAGWSATAALAMATHYFAAFILAAEVIWLLRHGQTRRRVLLACLPFVAVGLALVPLALEQRRNGGAQIGESSIATRISKAAKEFLVSVYGGPVDGLGPLCAVLVAVGAGIALWRTSSAEKRRIAVPLAIGAACLLLPLALALAGVDYFTARYLAIAWVPLFAALAAGLAAKRAGWAGPAVAAALAVVFLVVSVSVQLTPRLQRDDWRSATAALGEPNGARAILISPGVGFVPLRVYEPQISSPPAPRFAARELDVIVMTRDGRAPDPRPPAPGFHLVAADTDPTYVVTRFTSDTPRMVATADLQRARYTPDPTGVVYERGR